MTNRIRRYQRLWQEACSDPSTLAAVPSGFVAMPMSCFSLASQEAMERNRQIYQLAYDQAQAAADEKFINDWMI